MNRKNSGLTFVEIMVVTAILGVLISSIYVVFKSGIGAWLKSEERLDVIQNARVILDQLSKELPGAFVNDSVNADFVGTDGSGANPDTLEFVTSFAGKIYKLKYELAADDVLKRKYIENPPDYANDDYENTVGEPDGIAEAIIEFSHVVSDIQFYYLPVIAAPASADWTDNVVHSWDSTAGATRNKLPEAVKIALELVDNDNNTYQFETIVYLPNSTTN